MFPADDIDAPLEAGLGFDAVAASILGGGLPAGAEKHLKEAAASYHQDDTAESHLLAALDMAPDHPAALIGLYRFYFYKGRLPEALDVACICLGKASRELRLPSDWRFVGCDDADFGSYAAVLPRFFMFALKGYAYLQMRIGALDEGRAAVAKLLALDPSDKINAGLLVSVADRLGVDDDD
jgi:tetratricopeptide (TPR) repeat protein